MWLKYHSLNYFCYLIFLLILFKWVMWEPVTPKKYEREKIFHLQKAIHKYFIPLSTYENCNFSFSCAFAFSSVCISSSSLLLAPRSYTIYTFLDMTRRWLMSMRHKKVFNQQERENECFQWKYTHILCWQSVYTLFSLNENSSNIYSYTYLSLILFSYTYARQVLVKDEKVSLFFFTFLSSYLHAWLGLSLTQHLIDCTYFGDEKYNFFNSLRCYQQLESECVFFFKKNWWRKKNSKRFSAVKRKSRESGSSCFMKFICAISCN